MDRMQKLIQICIVKHKNETGLIRECQNDFLEFRYSIERVLPNISTV